MTYLLTIKIVDRDTASLNGPSAFGHMWYSLDDGSENPPLSFGFGPIDDNTRWNDAYGPGRVNAHGSDDDYYTGPLSHSRVIEISEPQYVALKSFGMNPEASGFSMQYNGLTNSCIDFVWKSLQVAGLNTLNLEGDPYPIWNAGLLDALRSLTKDNWYPGKRLIDARVPTAFHLATQAAPARRDPLILDLNNNGLDTTGIDTANPILFDHDGDGIKTATGWIKADDAYLVLDRNGNGSIDNGRELFGDATPLYPPSAGSGQATATDGFAALAQEDSNSDGKVDALDAHFANLRLWRDLNQDGISQAGELFTLASQGIAALIVAKTENAILLANGNQIADLGSFIRSDGSGGTLGAAEQLADVDLASNPFYSEFTDSIPLTAEAQTLPDMNGAGQVRSLRQAASLATPAGEALASQLAAFAAETTRSGQQARLNGLLKAWADTSTMATTATGAFAGVNLSVSFAGVGAGSAAYQAWLDKLSILERFNAQTFRPVPAAGTTLTIDFYAARETLLDQAYVALRESVYGALVVQTRLKPYLDSIALKIDDSGITLDYTAMMARLETRKSIDAANAVQDLLELQRFAGGQLSGWSGLATLDAWVSDPVSGPGVLSALVTAGLAYSGAWAGTPSGDYAIGGAGADQFSGDGGDDVLLGMQGNDTLYGGAGNDLLDGGVGDDLMEGGTGNDTYNFGRGMGRDTLRAFDPTAGKVDTLVLDGLNPADIALSKGAIDYDLTLTIKDTGEFIKVLAFYGDPTYRINQLQFADGTVWDAATLLAQEVSVYGGAGNDTLAGRNGGPNALHGNDGNDTLYGGDGIDRVSGGNGNDSLYGNAGNDLLDGGAGDDLLEGGTGNDTYVFGRGMGRDTLRAFDPTAGKVDTLVLDGLNPADIQLTKGATDNGLTATIKDTGESIKVLFFFGDPVHQVNQLKFADGTAWNAAAITAHALNKAPVVVAPIQDQATPETRQYAFSIPANAFVDPDSAAPLTLKATLADGAPLPGWMSFNPATRAFAGIPDGGGIGTLSIRVTAEDSLGAQTTDVFTLRVDPFNVAPVVANAIPGQSATEDSAYSFNVPPNTFADGNTHDTLTLSAALAGGAALPAWLHFDAAGGSLNGIPANGDVGTLSLQVTATDPSGAGVSTSFDIVVANTNNAPVATGALANQSAIESSSFSLVLPVGLFTDVDAGDTLKLAVTGGAGEGLPAWLAFDAATRTLSGTPGAGSQGSLSLAVRATDSAGASAEIPFTLTVQPALNQVLTGGSGNDALTGGAGNDILEGGLGADLLRGGAGDDTFLLSADGTWRAGFVCRNDGSPGHAGSLATVSIAGCVASWDALDGGSGSDLLVGTAGNDIMVLDDAYSPSPNGLQPRFAGIETIRAGAGDDVVDLTSSRWSAGDVSVAGEAGNDVLWTSSGNDTLLGGAGNDTLDGGFGRDSMAGGAGNDLYVVDDVGDAVIENHDEGTDTVQSRISYVLPDNVENLTLTGAAAINGSGNALDNLLTGTTGNNTLTGNAGNDTLDGKAGTDLLIGGGGDDTYVFGRGHGSDTVRDNDGTLGNADAARFLPGVRADQVWLRHVGNNLEASIIGTRDKLTVENWYLGTSYHVEQFKTADNRLLVDSRVELLVQAMAAFAPPAAGQTTLLPSYHDVLAPVIAANWQ